MELFSRLKDVADINKVAGVAGIGAAAEEEEPDIKWDETTSRGQLESMLRGTLAEMKRSATRYEDLRQESEQLRKEHGTFRAKVQAWRTQAQADREHSKKMILSLRAATDDTREDEYTKALHEQVAQLKEALRSLQEKAEGYKLEKELSEVKWKEKFDEYRGKLDYWRDMQSHGSARRASAVQSPSTELDDEGGGGGGVGGSGMAGGDLQGDSRATAEDFLLLQKDQELDMLKSRSADLEARNRELQEQVEELRSKNIDSAKQLQDLVEVHDQEMQSRDAADPQAKYIKDLETELKMWREEGRKDARREADSAADADSRAATPAPDAEGESSADPVSPRSATPGDGQALQLRRRLDEANATTAELRAQLASLRSRAESVDTDAGAREQALQDMYEENLQLRRTMGTYMQQASDATDMLRQKEKLLSQQKDIEERLEAKLHEVESASSKTQRSVQTVQKELSKRNDTIVRLRGELASLKDTPLPRDGAASRKLATETPGRLGSAGANKRGFGGQQELPLLSGIMSGESFTWRKMRVYLAVIFIAIFFLFSAYNSRTITQETDMTEKLTRCMQASHQQQAMIAELQKAQHASLSKQAT